MCRIPLYMENSSLKQPFHTLRRILAKNWLKLFPKLKIIAVTGSYGKTNTTQAISLVLAQKLKTLKTDLNLDTFYNLPITILKVRPWHEVLILECGVDHKGEMEKHLSLFTPKIVVITGISPVHSDFDLLGSVEGIIREKGKLLKVLKANDTAILNYDDDLVKTMAAMTKARIISYGSSKNFAIWADKVKVDLTGTSFSINSPKFRNGRIEVKIKLLGKHTVQEACVAAYIGLMLGLTEDQIKRGLSELQPLAGRLSLDNGPMNTLLLDDHLRANPASTKAGLETLAALPCRGRKIAVLGEMGELGIYKEEEHIKIGRLFKTLKINYLIGIGPLAKLMTKEAIKAGMNGQNVYWTENVYQAVQILKKILKKNDLWYLKGSLLRHLERVVLGLNGQNVNCDLVTCKEYGSCLECQSNPCEKLHKATSC